MKTIHSRWVLSLLFAVSCACCVADQPAGTRVLIIVGPSNHPPGSHEVAAGGRVMKYSLEHCENMGEITVDLAERWPEISRIDAASTIVFIGDTFPPNRMDNPKEKLADVKSAMDRGCGIACVHYATGLWGQDVAEDGDHPLLRWLGGYFANRTCPHHESFARIFDAATIEPDAMDHPILRGWKTFTLRDEPYINNYFGKDDNQMAANVTSLATSMLPPDNPKRETVAWCVERGDSGRGFGIVMPHFFKNWNNPDLRKFILNGIVWSAKREVPDSGVKTTLPELGTFQPASVEFQRKVKNK